MIRVTRLAGLAMAVAITAGTIGVSGAGAAATTRWHMQATPTPSGRAAEFTDVSCASATNCLAVGDSYGNTFRRLAERWNGGTWSTEVTPSATQDQLFYGVSCPSISFCVIVGNSELGTLIEQWNGSGWTEEPVFAGGTNRLYGVTCTSSTNCIAVGASDSQPLPLIAHWNGATWSSETPAADGPQRLERVTCVSATNCFAVGEHADSKTLVEHWDGSSWTAQTVQPVIGQGGFTELYGVACLSATNCFAVGKSEGSASQGSNYRRLVEHWNGHAWSIVVTPAPSNQQTEFHDVSCRGGNCVLVGESFMDYDSPRPYVVRWNGSTFAMESVQSPTPNGVGRFDGVACLSRTNCYAAGFRNGYLNINEARTLVEHSN